MCTDFAGNQSGFTMIEMIVGVLVSAILLTAIYKTHDYLQTSSLQQVEINRLQQNQRGVVAIMEREFRMIAADRDMTSQFGVTDVRRYDITDPVTTATPLNTADGSPILRFTADLDNNGLLGPNETITYLLYNRDGDPSDGFDLARSIVNPGNGLVGQRDLLAEGIDSIGFAYAFDRDRDGLIDRTPAPGNNIIWGVDTNNDGLLDADTANINLGYTVRPEFIRSVRIWILGRTQRPDPAYVDRNVYTLGNRTFDPPDGDHFRRWLVDQTIHLRNL
jgi:type IV pilus assembly protein PilW